MLKPICQAIKMHKRSGLVEGVHVNSIFDGGTCMAKKKAAKKKATKKKTAKKKK